MKLLVRFIYLFLVCSKVWARAGGAGGGHHSGGGHGFSSGGGPYGGGGGGGLDLIQLFFILPWWISIPLVCLAIFVWSRYAKKMAETPLSRTDQIGSVTDPYSSIDEIKNLPVEELVELKEKGRTAFSIIQRAWSHKNLQMMRRFISDGVYQRFNAQFTMMNILGQINTISNVEVLDIKVISYTTESLYECVALAITARCDDQFHSDRYPALDSPGGNETFIELWSFVRRKVCDKKSDIFHSENCPQCSAPLSEKLLDTARCPYCGSYLNSGEFDWVLSEIIQQEHLRPSPATAEWTPLEEKVLVRYPEFSPHILKDRASNAFLQVLVAITKRDLSALQRFTSPEAFAKLKNVVTETHMVYDRLYVGRVEIIAVSLDANILSCLVSIEYYFRRVRLDPAGAHLLDADVVSDIKTVKLIRDISGTAAKGNIFANACPNCGATQKDNLKPVCEYCGANLNDPRLDWVVDDLGQQKSL